MKTAIQRPLVLSLTFALLLTLPVQSQQVPNTGGDEKLASGAQQWSTEVWTAAIGGNKQALSEKFRTLPEEAGDFEVASRFRDSFELHLANEVRAQTKRQEARDKAGAELQEFVQADDLSKALRAAVTIQTLSDSMEAAFTDPEIGKVIAWAQERLPQVEAEADWLSAQELLFYLRTMYEDTSKVEQYKGYRDQLDAVNRRVALLAQYAPHRLHELRAKRAERLGEKIAEYKANPSNDWRVRSKGIKQEMVKEAMKRAASDHIEGQGWQPLVKGGLEELRLLATTASLEETFSKLADAKQVEQFVAFIEAKMREVASKPEFDSWNFAELLRELKAVNDQTVQLPEEVLYREFGDGALYELDEFSEVIWPDKLPRFKQATEGAFVGVGILIRHNDALDITVVNPIEGTPAYFGGVRPGDKILEVDGDPTLGWSLNDAVDRITGTPNTNVTLGLQREGVEDLIRLTLTRDVIKLRSVMGWWKKDLRADGTPEWDWFIDPVSRIAYIKLTQFNEDSYNDLLSAWREITEKGKPSGLILDLRFNPGGLLTSAVAISNLFVKNGTVVSVEGKDGQPSGRPQQADPTRARLSDVPVVVLINQGSASASEIVSGCLQAHSAAVIVGERSFGKGSVQTVYPTALNARLKLTTQYYRLPAGKGQEKGRLVHKRIGASIWGVDPDIEVKMTPQQITEAQEYRQKADVIPQDDKGNLLPESPDRPGVTKLIADGMDPQLETALLILQARALGDTVEETRHAMMKSQSR